MELQGLNTKTTGRDKHAPEVEPCIRTLKEWVRTTVNTLSFKKLSKLYIIRCSGYKDRVHLYSAHNHSDWIKNRFQQAL